MAASKHVLTRSRIWWIGLGIACAAMAAVALTLYHLRVEAIKQQQRELRLLSLALTDEIDKSLRGVEEGMQALQTELSESRLPLDEGGATRALKTRADLMPLVESLWLVDARWQPIAASDLTSLPSRSSLEPGIDALGESDMVVGRLDPPDPGSTARVVVAMRFDTPAGRRKGWILAAIPQRQMLGAFAAAALASDARMAVYRNDGMRLGGAPIDGVTEGETPVVHRSLARLDPATGRFAVVAGRLTYTNELKHFPVTVVLTRDVDAVLKDWRSTMRLTASVLALVVVVVSGSVVLLQRAIQTRLAAETALQVQGARATRLESLGTMAGSIAHDFNNVLAAILGFTEMARDFAEPGTTQARYLDRALQATLRGKSLAEHILTVSRGGARVSKAFELATVVDEVIGMLLSPLPSGIVLEKNLSAANSTVRGDPTQAFEALMNLCANAIQVMPDGGRLAIGLDCQTILAARTLSHSHLAAGRYVVLTVADEGSGISPEDMEHLFEPFFTTHGGQSGTGLGLAVVHGVVAEFQGGIDVSTKPAQGTRFTLFFPAIDKVDAPSDEAEPPPAPSGRGERVLVVDDEPELAGMTTEMLRDLGYSAYGLSNAPEALELLRGDPGRFAAVIADEVMPGLTGTAMTAALRQFAPDLPVLIVTGYGGASLAARAAEAGATVVLGKPIQRAVLARALAKAIGDRSQPK